MPAPPFRPLARGEEEPIYEEATGGEVVRVLVATP